MFNRKIIFSFLLLLTSIQIQAKDTNSYEAFIESDSKVTLQEMATVLEDFMKISKENQEEIKDLQSSITTIAHERRRFKADTDNKLIIVNKQLKDMQSNNRLNNQQIHNKLIIVNKQLKDVHFNNRLTNQRLQSSVKSIEKEKERKKFKADADNKDIDILTVNKQFVNKKIENMRVGE